jgi:hypothetical protein
VGGLLSFSSETKTERVKVIVLRGQLFEQWHFILSYTCQHNESSRISTKRKYG